MSSVWGVLNIFFLIASIRLYVSTHSLRTKLGPKMSWLCFMLTVLTRSIVYVLVFTAIEFCLVLDGVSQFVKADGHDETYAKMQKAAGAFGFIAGLLGYYCTAHYLCEEALGFSVPMGDTSRFFVKRRKTS